MKSLIIYFSRTGENYGVGNIKKGNTKIVAEAIALITKATLFECIPLIEYSTDYKKCCDEALKYQQEDARPELKEYLTDISAFDSIFIGGPIYWGEFPYEIYSELDKLDFKGKIIYSFSTHEGSGLGNVKAILTRKCRGAIIKEGLAIKGTSVKDNNLAKRINDWIIKGEKND